MCAGDAQKRYRETPISATLWGNEAGLRVIHHMLLLLIQHIFFFRCPFWLRHRARCWATSVGEKATVSALAPQELRSMEHDLGEVGSLQSPLGLPEPAHALCPLLKYGPSMYLEASGLGVGREEGKGRGNDVCLQQIGFPYIFQQTEESKNKEDVSRAPLRNK